MHRKLHFLLLLHNSHSGYETNIISHFIFNCFLCQYTFFSCILKLFIPFYFNSLIAKYAFYLLTSQYKYIFYNRFEKCGLISISFLHLFVYYVCQIIQCFPDFFSLFSIVFTKYVCVNVCVCVKNHFFFKYSYDTAGPFFGQKKNENQKISLIRL